MSLEVCSSGHDEIAYVEEYRGGARTKCPLCAAISAMDTLVSNLNSIPDYEPAGMDYEGETTAANDHWRDAIKAAT